MTLDPYHRPRASDAPPRRPPFDVDPDEMFDDDGPGADIAEANAPAVDLDALRVTRPAGRPRPR